MSSANLAFLGAGNIGGAIINGLINAGHDPATIIAADPDEGRRSHLAALGIATTDANANAIADADTIILCVKPSVVAAVSAEIAPYLTRRAALVISVAAGVPLSSLTRWLGAACPVVRCMPNTPATIGTGVTALLPSDAVNAEQRLRAAEILGAVGRCVWLASDAQMDAATAISGSGPAYFFYLMEAMEAAGSSIGLDADVCRELVVQTALGAAMLASQGDHSPAALRLQVTSPGGTTHAAISRMGELDFAALIDSAVQMAYRRAGELAGEFG